MRRQPDFFRFQTERLTRGDRELGWILPRQQMTPPTGSEARGPWQPKNIDPDGRNENYLYRARGDVRLTCSESNVSTTNNNLERMVVGSKRNEPEALPPRSRPWVRSLDVVLMVS